MNFKSLLTLIGLCFLGACIHVHNDKFGIENNAQRIKLGIPIIKKGWGRDANIHFPAPKNHTSWFTDSRPEDKTLPYHAYKTLYYNGDTLVSERDTYLNMNYKWFKNGIEIKESQDSFYIIFSRYHAIDVIYVYKQLYTTEKDFSSYTLGFNYEILGEKGGFSDTQSLTLKQTEEILNAWNLKRLNY